MKSREELIKELLELEYVEKEIIDNWSDEVIKNSIDYIKKAKKEKELKKMTDWLINECPNVTEVSWGMEYGQDEGSYMEYTKDGRTWAGRHRRF